MTSLNGFSVQIGFTKTPVLADSQSKVFLLFPTFPIFLCLFIPLAALYHQKIDPLPKNFDSPSLRKPSIIETVMQDVDS